MKPIRVNNYHEVYNNDIKDLDLGMHFLNNIINGSDGITRIINDYDDKEEFQDYFSFTSVPEDADIIWNCEKFRIFRHEYWEGDTPETERFYCDLYVFVKTEESDIETEVARNTKKIIEQLEKGEDIQLSYQKSKNKLHIKKIRVEKI